MPLIMELKDELQRRFGDKFFVIGKNDPGYDGIDADSLFEQNNEEDENQFLIHDWSPVGMGFVDENEVAEEVFQWNYKVPIGNAQMRNGEEVNTQVIQRFVRLNPSAYHNEDGSLVCEDFENVDWEDIDEEVWLIEKSWYITVCREEFWTGDGTSTCIDNALKFWDIDDAEKEMERVKKAYPKLSDDEIRVIENL
jgi:hypothetical protein